MIEPAPPRDRRDPARFTQVPPDPRQRLTQRALRLESCTGIRLRWSDSAPGRNGTCDLGPPVKKSQAQILSARLTNRVSGLRRRDTYQTKRLEVGDLLGTTSAERAVPRVRDGLPVGAQITLAQGVAVTIRRTRPLPSSSLWRLVATLVGM